MIEFLRTVDSQFFLFLNELHNSFFDFIMYYASNRWIWIPFYVYLLLLLRKNYHENFFTILVITILMIAVSDQLASGIIKNLVMRLRPCHNPVISPEVHLVRGYCGGLYGFVSSHASNSFALTTFLWILFSEKHAGLRWVLLSWAILVSYSRIYLGAHYPADVLCGALLGIAVGFGAEYCYRLYLNKKTIQSHE